ncbi:hypothetical protein M406DRAFT_327635 [Cryphonectria parasitica EP155]|uniref:Uncharacterized protein n=1 Tax=Cryphonectria parasitica (strain ATCC 38755 / EP155) TaxID=660469 RepID=A0A9P4YA67_CRYP1|nr:uncharacterized protein M406DRAFT_327635 [Cryphonectria parasitica EP155]KAF3769244.1 hypothetical protein M406DRAFT_327635 [Cryphonectria parasitica EP155]
MTTACLAPLPCVMVTVVPPFLGHAHFSSRHCGSEAPLVALEVEEACTESSCCRYGFIRKLIVHLGIQVSQQAPKDLAISDPEMTCVGPDHLLPQTSDNIEQGGDSLELEA